MNSPLLASLNSRHTGANHGQRRAQPFAPLALVHSARFPQGLRPLAPHVCCIGDTLNRGVRSRLQQQGTWLQAIAALAVQAASATADCSTVATSAAPVHVTTAAVITTSSTKFVGHSILFAPCSVSNGVGRLRLERLCLGVLRAPFLHVGPSFWRAQVVVGVLQAVGEAHFFRCDVAFGRHSLHGLRPGTLGL
jgi:hypothetical protein